MKPNITKERALDIITNILSWAWMHNDEFVRTLVKEARMTDEEIEYFGCKQAFDEDTYEVRKW